MKKYLLSTVLSICSALPVFSQVMLSDFPPLNNYPYTFYESIFGVATDAQSNVFIAGNQSGSPEFYSDTAYALIQKYDASENLLWEGRIVNNWSNTNPAQPRGADVCTDAAGNSYLIGTTENDTVQLVGSAPIIGNSEKKMFVAKYSPTGTVVWVRVISGTTDVVAKSIQSDAAGNLYIAGLSAGPSVELGNGITVNLAPSPFPNTAYTSFVAKISSAGTTLWGIGLNVNYPTVKTNAAGEVFLSGTAPAQLSIGNTNYTGTNKRFFVAKLTTLGVPAWVKSSTTMAYLGFGLAPDASGGAFVAGSFFDGNLELDGVTLAPIPGYTTYFMAKYTAGGQLEWAKTMADITSQPKVSVADLLVDAGGNCLVSGSAAGPYPNIATGIGTNRDSYLASVDDDGNLIWDVLGGNDTHDDYLGRMSLNSQQQVYVTAGVTDFMYLLSPVPFLFGNNQTSVQAAFEPTKVLKVFAGSTNRITGRIFYDYNSNGIKDATDTYAVGQIVETLPTNIYSASSNQNGLYKSFTETGTYTLSLPSPPPYYTSVPASHNVTFANTGNSDTTRHFALQPMPNMQDLEVVLTSSCPPRPGTGYYQQITYRNVGTTVLSGSVQLTYDALWNYQSSTPAPASQTGNTLTWNFSNLQPNQTGIITAGGFIPTFAVLGASFTSTAQVLPLAGDLTPANNSYQLAETVVNSYDPNDKTVSQNWLTPTEVAEAKPLEYTIRFQNTGTAEAIHVKLIDTLDTQLNIPTFELLSSSHTCTWNIRGNGIIEFRFDNILLPDSNTNEPASHGFVKYRIKPNTNLALGSIIRNTAAIYFDFNEPIFTNTASTEIALFSGVNEAHKPQLQVYPNPNKGAFMVQLQNVREQSVKAELRNLLGQTVWQQNLASENGNVQQQIKTSNLSKGIYYLQVSTGKGTTVQKVVIE